MRERLRGNFLERSFSPKPLFKNFCDERIRLGEAGYFERTLFGEADYLAAAKR